MRHALAPARFRDCFNARHVILPVIHVETEEQAAARRVLTAHRRNGSRALYFGGVAFKYQRHVNDLAAAAPRRQRTWT